MVFDSDWFEKHQKPLLWLANTAIGRRILCVHGDRSGVGTNRITRITPEAIFWEENGYGKIEFRTHDKFGKRVYHAFKPFWYLLHTIDLITAAFQVNLDFGFASLVAYPTTITDGYTERRVTTAETFSTIRAGAGNGYNRTATSVVVRLASSSSSGYYDDVTRGKLGFGTASLPSGARILGASISLYGDAKIGTLGTGALHVVGTTSIYKDVTTGDHVTFGTTSFGNVSYAGFSTTGYNDITLSSDSYSSINSISSKFGLREYYDFANVEPTWVASSFHSFSFKSADESGTSYDPKLTITYILSNQKLYYTTWGGDSSYGYAGGELKFADASSWSAGTDKWSTYTPMTPDANFKLTIEDAAGGSLGGLKGLFIFKEEDGTQTLLRMRGKYLDIEDDNATQGWRMLDDVYATSAEKCEGVNAYIDDAERLYITHDHTADLSFTDGSTVTVIADYEAKHIEYFQNRLYLGNVTVSDTAYPIRVLFSPPGLDTFDNNTDYFDDMGEPITALKVYGNNLYIWSENKMGAYDGYQLRFIAGDYGTPSARSVQSVDGYLLFYNRRGVWIYNGSERPVLVSRQVEKWIEAISNPESVAAGIDKYGRYRLYLGDVTVDGTVYEDKVIVYDVSNNCWDTRGAMPFAVWANKEVDEQIVPYAGSPDTAAVYKVDDGNDFNGGSIASTWQSPLMDMGRPHDLKSFYKVHITMKPTGANEHLTVMYRTTGSTWLQMQGTLDNVDLDGTDEIEQVVINFPKNVVSRFIQIQITHSSTASGFEIYKVEVEYDVIARP